MSVLTAGLRRIVRQALAPDVERDAPPFVPMSGMILEAPGEPAPVLPAAKAPSRVAELGGVALDLFGLASIPVGLGVWQGLGPGLIAGGIAALWLSSRLA